MSHFLTAAEIVRNLRLHFPINVSYPDPFDSGAVSCSRENLMALLVVDGANVHEDAGQVAALYAELGRLTRAATYAADLKEAEYRTWKAQVSRVFRDAAAAKKPTVAEVEDHYRELPKYDEFQTTILKLKAQAAILEDCRDAFKIKARALSDTVSAQRDYYRVVANEDRAESGSERRSSSAKMSWMADDAAAIVADPSAVEAAEKIVSATKNAREGKPVSTKKPRSITEE